MRYTSHLLLKDICSFFFKITWKISQHEFFGLLHPADQVNKNSSDYWVDAHMEGSANIQHNSALVE